MFLFLVFSLSITPTKILHTLFADHKDAKEISTHASNELAISVALYHCQCDNLVVESPFSLQLNPIFTEVLELTINNNSARESDFYSIPHFYSELRGPPSLG